MLFFYPQNPTNDCLTFSSGIYLTTLTMKEVMKEPTISALLIVFNEEKNIEDALQSVEFADEIIVLSLIHI